MFCDHTGFSGWADGVEIVVLQLTYVSSVSPGAAADPAQILSASRRNNARNGITGMLYSDGARFMQALEGPADAVQAAFDRIRTDPRHRAVVLLSRREVAEREFGPWEMAHRQAGEDADAFIAHISRLVANASADVKATFESFAQLRKAA
jgi:hypothetical protein